MVAHRRNPMKAVILVGGLGTRLRPLTCNKPKPLIPLANRPLIEHMLIRLRDQGIKEIILAVQYLADRFRSFLGTGTQFGIKLHVIEEPQPLGTAGAVKNAIHLLDDTTFVFNGDVVTDLDLRALLAFHRQRQSKATIALTAVDDPSQFGLVELDSTQRIGRFIEKPRAEDITSNLINAGTYVLETEIFDRVRPNQHSMFERDLFPALLQSGEPVYGFPAQAYWADVGKPQNYLEVNQDILMGRVRYNVPGHQIDNRVWLEGTFNIHEDVQVIAPVVIGSGVSIGHGTRIIGPSVIGARCQIGPNVIIESAVLWEDNRIEEGTVIRSCVLGHGNIIGAGCTISGGAIISDGCIIGAANRLERGIKLWPGTMVKDQAISF